MRNCVTAIVACVTLLALAGCGQKEYEPGVIQIMQPGDEAVLRQEEARRAQDPEEAPEMRTLAAQAAPLYRVGPGDVLEVVYHIHYEKSPEDYHLEIQDRISVHLPYNPQFSSSTVIRTDGKISLPLVGELAVAGMTVNELTEELRRRYAKFIKQPVLNVSLEEFNVKIDELKRAITTAPRGQSKIAPITPDGRTAFPIIGNLVAAGKTVPELEAELNKRYSDYIRNLQVTLILLEIHYNRAYVLGEVRQPGHYEIGNRPSLPQVLAHAGGFTSDANLSQVLVIRNEGLAKPMVFVVDVESMLKRGAWYNDLYMHPADIIYVPKSDIADVNDTLNKIFTKGLYTVIPFTSSFSATYDIRGTGTSVIP